MEDLVRELDGLRDEDDGEHPVEDVVRCGPQREVLAMQRSPLCTSSQPRKETGRRTLRMNQFSFRY